MLETLRGIDPAKFKELFRLVVPEIRVESRAAIRPLVFLPLVRFMVTAVDATKHYLNRYPLLQELLARRIS